MQTYQLDTTHYYTFEYTWYCVLEFHAYKAYNKFRMGNVEETFL